jgi:hypothetical protein
MSVRRTMLALGPAALLLLTGATTVVRPTGDPAQDLANVQAAVDRGGTVLLKATDASGTPRAFDFGDYPVGTYNWNYFGNPRGYVALGTAGEIVPVDFVTPSGASQTAYVSINNDVRLRGESDAGVTTTIRGGTIPVRNFAPRDVLGHGTQFVYGLSSMTVEGIRFEGSTLQSIYTFGARDVPEVNAALAARHVDIEIVIRRNQFVDLKPTYDDYFQLWYTLGAVTDRPQGPVTVVGNVRRQAPGLWTAAERDYEQANGIVGASELFESFSIAGLDFRGVISGNDIQDTYIGPLVYQGGSSPVWIEHNRVRLQRDGAVAIACYANHTYHVSHNTILLSGAYPDGILVWPDDDSVGIQKSEITHNRIVQDGSDYGGISLYGASSNNLVADNTVEGSGAYAFGLLDGGSGAPQRNNTFVNNRLSRFAPRMSAYFGFATDVFFDRTAADNVFIGCAPSVIDLGTGDKVLPGGGCHDDGEHH